MVTNSHDSTLQSIETVNVDGSGRHTFPEIFLEDDNPIGLAIFENSFFWANKIHLYHTSPHIPKERAVLLNASISAFSILHKSQQPKGMSLTCSLLIAVDVNFSALHRKLKKAQRPVYGRKPNIH